VTHTPRVSAVIPFYGEPEPVLAIIDTLRAQKGIDPSDVEIVVSDDVSPVPFPEVEGVTVVRRAVNGGFGKAVNSGVAAATGEWVFILNSDLELDDTFISRMLAATEAHGQVLASPQVIGHDGQQQWVARKFPTTGHIAWEWFTPLARFKPTKWWHRGVGHDVQACTGTSDAKVDWVMGACMVVPRAVFNRLGGMDEPFRLSSAGVDRYLIPSVTVTHEGGGSSPSERRIQWLTTARFIYADKWGWEKKLAVALRATSYANFLVNSVRALRNKDVDARGFLAAELERIAKAERREN